MCFLLFKDYTKLDTFNLGNLTTILEVDENECQSDLDIFVKKVDSFGKYISNLKTIILKEINLKIAVL